MRSSRSLPRSRMLLSAALSATVITACTLTRHEDHDPLRQAVVPLTVVFPDTIAAGASWRVDTFVIVGSNLCWGIESIGVTRTDSRLTVAGTATMASGSGACATAIADDWVDLPVSPLESGDYDVIAGNLAASATVREGSPSTRLRLVAQGVLYPDGPRWWFRAATTTYEVENPDVIERPGDARVTGTVDSLNAARIRVDHVDHLESD